MLFIACDENDTSKVYGWGENGFHQLGTPETSTFNEPQLVTLPENMNPLLVSAGPTHSLYLLENKEGEQKIYVAG